KNGVHTCRTQKTGKIGAVKGAGTLLDENLFAIHRSNSGIDCPNILIFLVNDIYRDFVVPQAHIGVRIVTVSYLITRGHMYDRMTVRSAGCKQTLDARNNLVVDVLAGKRVP